MALDRGRYIAMPGDEDNRQMRVYLLSLHKEFQAIHVRQADIADHHTRPFG